MASLKRCPDPNHATFMQTGRGRKWRPRSPAPQLRRYFERGRDAAHSSVERVEDYEVDRVIARG
jgi:hypothetical protein